MNGNSLVLDTNAEEAIRAALSKIHYEKCLLFGSRARGSAGEGSDYDLLVIIGKALAHQEKIVMAAAIRRELAAKFIDADIIIRSVGEVEAHRELRGSVVRNALLEGVAIWPAKRTRASGLQRKCGNSSGASLRHSSTYRT